MRIVLSAFTKPEINLAIESILFKHKPVNQRLLYVYFNDPCIVIGRNQNPWAECRLNTEIPILRRRSGGGAVVHSLGNANFCVQTSRMEFSRDKHLKMLVDAFPQLNLNINSRHDLVLNGKKVSGSAFKIERDKAYHHATLLLNADLTQLSGLLRPDESVQGRVLQSGATDSVKSPVTNTNLSKTEFIDGVVKTFNKMYSHENVHPEQAQITDEVLEEAETLKSWDWVFGKTPKFEIEFGGEQFEVIRGLKPNGERMPLVL